MYYYYNGLFIKTAGSGCFGYTIKSDDAMKGTWNPSAYAESCHKSVYGDKAAIIEMTNRSLPMKLPFCIK